MKLKIFPFTFTFIDQLFDWSQNQGKRGSQLMRDIGIKSKPFFIKIHLLFSSYPLGEQFLLQMNSSNDKTLQEKGFIPVENGEAFEVYKLSKNNTLNPALWITEIYIPIQPIQPVQPVQIN